MTDSAGTMKVYAVSLLFTVLVGFSFLFSKLAVISATPLELITYRFNFAVIAVFAALALRIVHIDLKNKPFMKVFPIAATYGGFIAIQAIGIKYATSIEGGIIFAIVPIITMVVASLMLHEKTTGLQKVFVSMSVTGVILMFVIGAGWDAGFNIKGIFLLFLSSLSMAFSNVLMRHARKIFTPTEISFVIVTGCCVAANIVTIINGIQNGTIMEYLRPMSDWKFAVSVIYLGVTCTFITSLLMCYMLAHMEAVKATLFGNLSTAISIVAGVLIFGEPLTIYHIICTMLIITGVIGTSTAGRKKAEVEEPRDKE